MTTQNVIKKPAAPIKTTRRGIVTALIAFSIWGAFPLYFKQLSDYNATEIIGHRIVWTFACLLVVLVVTKRWQWIDTLKKNPRWIAYTFVSGIIIAINWLTYVWAVNNNQILEASLGYFIGPLVGVGLSMLLFKERLRTLQWVAIGFALLSVVIQVVMLGSLPWVSLILAFSFSTYGTIQRQTPLTAVDAMFVETAMLLPIFIAWFWQSDVASSNISFWFTPSIWLLMLAGPITLIPLLMFNKSTKLVAYSILSFMNYLTPTFIFFLAVFYYNEPFDLHRLAVFGLIWLGLLLFSIDLWRHRPSKQLKAARLREEALTSK
ncbi:EamA family transporter RarD [Psychrobacter cryohalolentis]|uniref:RarD protein n=1 Tax=Psychrobacter cryohalolentis (strain ATCC BAA-1226 / DSM 17306 / VKM B-2378 / K5) TaxID=335284 RepID=Q1QBG5_PSYCK|nr:EamA family transporter RarD [Psychrobacter cryohalolentis]ABE74988.1 rarD protein [Psychrobacter cryohalolentis K5]ASE27473.1 EamA family transporter RarD [Psychrobacter cryohalolentis]